MENEMELGNCDYIGAKSLNISSILHPLPPKVPP